MSLEGIGLGVTEVGRVTARLARLLEATLAERDLTLPQYRLLFVLASEPSAQARLAARLAVSPPSVTAVVDGLVARGLVARVPDELDRRRVVHEVTPKGRKVLRDADAAADSKLAEIAANVDSRTAQRALTGLEIWGRVFEARAKKDRNEPVAARGGGRPRR